MIEIRTNVKRNKGKVKADVALAEFYSEYCRMEEVKGRTPKDYKTYSKILKEVNKAIVDLCLKGETVKFPYNLGKLGIIKYEVDFNPEKQNIWKVDYKKSKELGMIVYFDSPYRYKWKWNKNEVNLIGKRWYKFLPLRQNSRAIAQIIRENPKLDYYTKLS